MTQDIARLRIKYEMIINEAMRIAMDYDTPNDEINQFIAILGTEMGCDRIYLFEDHIGEDITDNTYEWCAGSVTPQIDELQNVDKEIIRWWYNAFDEGNHILLQDLEAIRETEPLTYEILKSQGIRNLIVYPMIHKDRVIGFFGVDNPPAEDMDEISIFLSMISSFLVSLIKLRNAFARVENQGRLDSMAALAEIYISMHLIDMKTGEFQGIKSNAYIDAGIDHSKKMLFPLQIHEVMCELANEKYLDKVLDFTNIRTLEERLQKKKTIETEFLGNVAGWCRARFIAVDYDEDGHLWHVIFAVEDIDEKKKHERYLTYLSQTDMMTGLKNRGSGEQEITQLLADRKKGLFCILDCDNFKCINDTYGHAVGDKVIIAVAEVLQKHSGKKDVVMRLGGDEFAIYYPDLLDEDLAKKEVDAIFHGIAGIRIPEMGQSPIYLSLGASFYRQKEQMSFDRLYQEADQAMYASKKQAGFAMTIYHTVE